MVELIASSQRAIILAGGFGTRISEETSDKPKPMVLIGEYPILWQIMSIYDHFGVTKFVVATGYKAEVIDEWLASIAKNINSSPSQNEYILYNNWQVTTIFTGLDSLTGTRLNQIHRIFPKESFFATYGDGVANIDLPQLLNEHIRSGCIATVTAVHPPARFGYLEIEGNLVSNFSEKMRSKEEWINGGFFYLEASAFGFINDLNESFEEGALPRISAARKLNAYKHQGFWQPMDTLREKKELEKLAGIDNPPWMSF
jgi:glucose-1-phosphate cytidylyltransferase